MAKDIRRFVEAERKLWEHIGATPTERRVTLANGGTVRVQELGDGPPFVLVHGGSIGGSSWCTLAAALDGVRCIMVDRPGCGLSDPIVDGPLTELSQLERYGDRLLGDLLDALELDSAAVGATSYGGFFALRGAAAAPDRVSKLVEYSWLIGAPAEGAPFSVRMAAVPGVQPLMARMPMSRFMVKNALRQFGLGRAIDSGAFDDAMLDWAHALLRHTDTLANETGSTPNLFHAIKGQNTDVLLSDELLAKLTMPSLFLWGEDDPNGGAAIAREFVPRVPGGELVIVEGAEHAPWFDNLELCAERTQSFLLN